MFVYGLIGSNAQDEPLEAYQTVPEGWVLMLNGRRPEDGIKYYAGENGEWLAGSAPHVLQQMINEATQKQISILSHASDMIGALSDEIEGLEDSDDAVPDKLRTDLKAWKQYRVKVKNIDVSLVPDIEWPVSPDAVLTEV
ncbi:tail fiber assembly protein [Yersinia mollaretii]|uniref:tail fiber assembly protein n=1 Tax=Yersinia mollaretii TaxID=33060 RepID=UPI0025AB48D9|nr:tail fiber assembly protein [Yersinia mollaretii]HDL6906120.1 tail fiber assembly protein [Yersinia enterocolitica]MDN0112490.1 tail fiber assembly protein [Yersinia mollaretii]HDL6910759.1 tail fiber assembly protein [Yersinia enterocolitica]HDL7029102.1 tail fiber assembly protein [Yersinia enterocolitica]HDL7037960.1 tail fiber assembly protein [Yersinia enterocolitica]